MKDNENLTGAKSVDMSGLVPMVECNKGKDSMMRFWTIVVCAVEGFLYAAVMVGIHSELWENPEFIDIWDSQGCYYVIVPLQRLKWMPLVQDYRTGLLMMLRISAWEPLLLLVDYKTDMVSGEKVTLVTWKKICSLEFQGMKTRGLN